MALSRVPRWRKHDASYEPASVDLLGRRDLVDALAAMLDHPHQGTPFTIALLGDWGAGKTSVMKLLEQTLDGSEANDNQKGYAGAFRHSRHEFLFAWFNAWEYEKTDNIAAGLAQEIVGGITSKLSPIRKCWLQARFALSEHRWRFAWALGKFLLPWVLAAGAGCVALAPNLSTSQPSADALTRVFSGTFAIGMLAFGARL